MAIKEEILFTSNFKDALKELNKFSKEANKTISAVSKSFTALKAVAVAAVGVFASKQLFDAFDTAIKKASLEQNAIQKLNTALQLTGQYTKKTSQELVNYAQQLELTTLFSSEAVLASQALIASLTRIGGEDLKKATSAAADLATVLGIDLNTASQLISKSILGNVESLKRYGIEAKVGASKAETLSNVLGAINGKFGGSAAAQINTYAGALHQMGAAVEDIQKFFGKLVVESKVVIGAINGISKIFINTADQFKDNEAAITDFIETLVIFAVKAVPAVNNSLRFLVNGFYGLINVAQLARIGFLGLAKALTLGQSDTVNKFLEEAQRGLTGIEKSFDSFNGSVTVINEQFKEVGRSLEKLKGQKIEPPKLAPSKPLSEEDFFDRKNIEKALNSIKGSFDKLKSGVETISTEITKETRTQAEIIEQQYDAASKLADNSIKELKLQKLLTGEAEAQIAKFLELADIRRTIAREALKPINIIFKNLNEGKGLAESFSAGLKGAFAQVDSTAFAQSFTKQIGLNLTAALTAGANLIGSVISTAGSFFANLLDGTFVNGLGSAVNDIGSFPQKLLDAFKNLDEIVTNLLDSLPGVIEKLLEAIPKVVQSFVEKFPQIIQMLLDALPEIVDKLSTALTQVVGTIVDVLPKIIDALPALIQRALEELPKVIEKILKGLPNIIKSIFNALPQIISSIIEAIPEIILVFLQNIPTIIEAFVEGFTKMASDPNFATNLMTNLIKALPDLVLAFVKLSPMITMSIIRGLANGLVSGLGPSVKKLFSNISFPALKFDAAGMEKLRDIMSGKMLYDKLKDVFKEPEFLKKLEDLFGNFQIGGGGGKKWYNLASGGTVPKGFPDDDFPASLTSGEMVVPVDDVSRLQRFLSTYDRGDMTKSQDSGLDMEALAQMINDRPLIVNLTIGEEQLATAVFNARRRGFRI